MKGLHATLWGAIVSLRSEGKRSMVDRRRANDRRRLTLNIDLR